MFARRRRKFFRIYSYIDKFCKGKPRLWEDIFMYVNFWPRFPYIRPGRLHWNNFPIYEDGYYKTCINGKVWMIYRAYICFYMRQLELTDPHQNYTPQVVFSELFRGNIHFSQKGLFQSSETISVTVQNPILNWIRCSHWNGLAALKRPFY